MISEDKKRQKQIRSIVFHTIFISFTVAVFFFLFWELRSLILPLIIGALLAYIFRPLKNFIKIPWVSENLKTMIIFAFIIVVITMGTKKIKNSLPNKKEQKELQVRVKYKFNEKYRSIMGITKPEDKGNFLHKTLHKDLIPVIENINKHLT